MRKAFTHTNDDPKWLRRFKRFTVAVVAGLAGVVLATTLDVAEKMLHFLREFGVTTSETMTLARDSEKSRFSDTLVRAAHRRLMLGEIFARRIQDGTPAEQIVCSRADRLERRLDDQHSWTGATLHSEKSRELETIIQPRFIEFDLAVRSLYLGRLGKASLVHDHADDYATFIGRFLARQVR